MRPADLFEQADRLLAPTGAGALKAVDKRRAVSAAYSAVFHAVETAVADELVGKTQRARKSKPYNAVYRSIGHERLRRLCAETRKPVPKGVLRSYWPQGGFGSDLKAFAKAFSDLIQSRHDADYDPNYRIDLATARDMVATARSFVASFAAASPAERKLFAVLLVCEPHG